MLRLLYSFFLGMSIVFSSFFRSIILVFLDHRAKKELQTASHCLKFLYKYTILFFTFLQFLRQIWKHTDRPFQDALHIGNGDAVVSDRHILINSTFHPIADLALIQHTASAMNNQCIYRQIFRKFSAGTQLNIQLFACVILQPSRYLNTANIITLAMMGASLCE